MGDSWYAHAPGAGLEGGGCYTHSAGASLVGGGCYTHSSGGSLLGDCCEIFEFNISGPDSELAIQVIQELKNCFQNQQSR